MVKVLTYILGLVFIWTFTIGLLRYEEVRKDSEEEK